MVVLSSFMAIAAAQRPAHAAPSEGCSRESSREPCVLARPAPAGTVCAPAGACSGRACADPGYNVTASEWIDEHYELRFNSVVDAQILFRFSLHKLTLGNLTGAGADAIRAAYAQDPAAISATLTDVSRAMSNNTISDSFSSFSARISGNESEVALDNASLSIPADLDPYNPPIVVRGYMRVDISLLTFNITVPQKYKPRDILMGILGMGAEIKVPFPMNCPAGHNQTVVSYPPQGVIFGDGAAYYPATPLNWTIANFEGSAAVFEQKTLAMMAQKRAIANGGKVFIGIGVEFDIAEFKATGETVFRTNITGSVALHRVPVNSTVQKWYSEYIFLNYLNSDFLRFLYQLGAITGLQFSAYTAMISQLIRTGIASMFPHVSNLTTSLEITGLDLPFDVSSLSDARPIKISVNAAFTYLYEPTRESSAKSFPPAGGRLPQTILYTLRRTFVATLPGPADSGFNFLGEGWLNYSFVMPRNVIIFNASANGQRLDISKGKDDRYRFSVCLPSNATKKSLHVQFGAEIAYNFETLVPYFILIAVLVALWGWLMLLGRKKRKEAEEEKKHRAASADSSEEEEG